MKRRQHQMPRPPDILRKGGSHKDRRKEALDKAARRDMEESRGRTRPERP